MKKIFIAFLIFLTAPAIAQDIHFTQYASSPLTLNPSNTGLINGNYRAATNYRNQWSSIGSPFVTTTLSYDMHLFKEKLNGSSVGIGLLGIYDQSGTGVLTNRTVGLSLAYHQKLNSNPDKPSTLSIGGQAYLVEKTIDESKLVTVTPVNVGLIDPYLDINIGLMYTGYLNSRSTIYSGVSYYHANRPYESFFGDDYRVHPRISVQLGANYSVNNRLRLYGSALYQKQNLAYEIVMGGAAGILLNSQADKRKQKELFLGTWFRYNDAIAPYLGFEWQNTRFGFSYDVNVSSLTPATSGNGAFELSLIYNGSFKSSASNMYNFAYPRF